MSEEFKSLNLFQRLALASSIGFKVARGSRSKGDPVFPRGAFGSLWSGPGFIGSLSQMLSFGSFRGTSINYADEVGEQTSSSLCMAVWQYMGTALTEAPPIVKAYEKGSTHGEVIPDHPLVQLLQQPNPHTDGATLLMAFTLDWLFSGDSYWIKVFDNNFQTPVQLWYVPYYMMQPLGDERNPSVLIKEYQYIVDGHRYSYLPEEIVHIRRGINPRDLRRGIAVFDSVLRELYTDNQAANFSAVVLKNWGVLPFVLSPPKNTKGGELLKAFGDDPNKAEEKAKRIKAKFMEATTGDKRGEPVVNTIPLEITKLGFSPHELDISELRKIPESRVAGVTGLPAALLQFLVGLEHGTSYASYKEAREQAYESVIAPLLKIIASAINRQLMPDFGDPDGRRLELSFDLADVRVLQEDQSKIYERANIGVGGGWLTVADARGMTGHESDEYDKIYIRGGQPVEAGKPPIAPTPPSDSKPLPENPAQLELEDDTNKLIKAVMLKLLTEKNGNGHKPIIVDGEIVEDSLALIKGGAGSGHFGHSGRPGLIGGSAPSIGVMGHPVYEQQLFELENQLERIAELRSSDKPSGFKYASVEEFVLDNGEAFQSTPLPKEIRQGKLGYCFMNAYQVVEYNPEKQLEYVEGYARTSSVPFALEHAWAIDKDGNVVDPTWERLRRKGETITYYGVVVPMDTVRKTIFAREKYGVLHNPEQGFPLLRDGLEVKGGVGSGNFGHHGRPGLVGGSSSNGGAPTALDRRLVDYKPDRSLSDPNQTRPLDKLLTAHNVVLEHYSQMPFLEQLHSEIGVEDPKTIAIADYVAKRDEFFSALPVVEVALDNIVVTQEKVNVERVQQIRDDPATVGGKSPYLVRYGGTTYVINGHHRIAADVLDDKPSIAGHVWELDAESKGGAGSGHFGHAGRPGLVGGSSPSGGSQPTDTQTIYKRGGSYTKERVEKVHKPIIDKIFDGAVKSDDRIVYFLGGGPAAGKTTAIIARLESEGLLDGVVRIDPDAIKTDIPDYQDLVAQRDPSASAFVHEEASDLSKDALFKANGEYNTLYDTTGDNDIDKLQAKVENMRRNGAKTINAEYAFITDVDEAVRRSNERAQRTGRHVHEPFIRKTHASIAKVFPEALKRGIFDSAKLFNTDGREPVLTATYDRVGGLRIHNQTLWDKFTGLGNG